MKAKDFDTLTKNILVQLADTLRAGQKEYAHGVDDNVFNNFIRMSKELNVTKEQVLWIFMSKHRDGILAHMKGHKSQREPVQGRILDHIVYLIILWAMFDENDKTNSLMNMLDEGRLNAQSGQSDAAYKNALNDQMCNMLTSDKQ